MQSLLPTITRLYPLYKGRGRLALSGLLRPSNDELVAARLTTGPVIHVRPNDYIGRMVLFFGDLDPSITTFVESNVAPGDTVVDVGANFGVVALTAAQRVGPAGTVVAIEPNVAVAEALRRSLAANRFTNTRIVTKALSDYSGSAVLTVPRNSCGQAALADGALDGERCEVTRLDDLELPKRVRLLKIDVEGHEHRVLCGGSKLLGSGRVDLVVFESHPARGHFFSRDEVRFLLERGYRLYELHRSAWLRARMSEITRADHVPRSHDFVAVGRGVRRAMSF